MDYHLPSLFFGVFCAIFGHHFISAQIILDLPPAADKPAVTRSYIYSAGPWRGNISARNKRGVVRVPRGNGLVDYEDPAPPQLDVDGEGEQPTSRNVSVLLNGLFVDYTKTVRPGMQYGPTMVETSLVVISLGPISELNSDYSMDCYFRQYWRDERLTFNASDNLQEIALNNLMLDNIWKPDTYFRNGKEYYVHTITTANKLLRLSPNGDILYSLRMTIRAQCPMVLTFYPADMQSCPLIIGSFAYQSKDILYRWHLEGVKTAGNLTLSQFEMDNFTWNNFVARFNRGARKDNYSMVRVDFKLQRRMGYFVLQIYLPCMLIVVLSWVSFWLNREATERLTLGITAFLTLATTNQDQKDILPKTSFPTALEWYILICNTYVSASIIQFAAVHFFTKAGFEEINFARTDSRDTVDDEWETIPKSKWKGASFKILSTTDKSRDQDYGNATSSNYSNHRPVKYKINDDHVEFEHESCWKKLIYCITGNEHYRAELIRRGKYRQTSNSVSMLDRVSRVLFPLSFAIVNLFYWTSFLYAKPPKLVVVGDE